MYSAIVAGGEDYDISLNYRNEWWFGQCSCPMMFDCKHIVAALLELKAQAGGEKQLPAEPVPAARQPPRSTLSEKLRESLGRKLAHHEAQFVRTVQAHYDGAPFRKLTEGDLASIAMRPNQFYGYNPLELWPKLPKDDYDFWLHVAWELQRRNWAIPKFIQPITDLGLIEPVMSQWEREREIERWTKWLGDFREKPAAREHNASLQLRLAVFSHQARLQWRQSDSAPFCDFKQTHAKKFGEQFDRAELVLSPQSLPLWSASYKPWHYNSWWSFDFSDSSARPALNRLLRLPLSPDHVVTGEGQPLIRHADPLRLELGSPTDAEGDYELKLARADGSAPPRIDCTLEGHPTLYLTAEGLFEGPSAEALEKESKRKIPAAAPKPSMARDSSRH